jgi:aryl-alcohol dehydrogenase-like predicted oxidoreductase
MDTRTIGSLAASIVGVGGNQFGTACDERATAAVVNAAVDAGINFFDTADEYGEGLSEEYIGRALQGRREDVLVASKFGIPQANVPGSGGGSARWVKAAADASLRRLGRDHIDLYQLHRPDPTVPIEETLGALNELIEAGKVREIGCCNFSGAQLDEAAAAAGRLGLRPFVSTQNLLNVLQRTALDDVMPAAHRHGLAVLPYHPLASGVLSGKYRRGAAPAAGTRFAEQLTAEQQAKLLSDRTFARLDALEAYAEQHGHGVLELAMGWLLADPAVASVIAGATRPEQPAANVAAATWILSEGEAAKVARLVAEATA